MSAPPRLGRGVIITRRQVSEEEIYYLVKDPRTGSFLRMGEVEAALLRLLDGRRTLSEVASTLAESHGFNVGLPAIETFVASLTTRGLIESRSFDPGEFRKEWVQQQRSRRRTLGQLLGSLTYLKVHLFNPQQLFRMLARPLRFFWTPAFVVGALAIMAVAGAMSIYQHEEILKSAHAFYVSATASSGALAQHALIFYVVLFLVVAVHELAHGLTCAYFGGKVTDMGFILFYLQVPGMYCDITDAYSFERRADRLWTTFAGSFTGLLLASVGLFAWWATEAGDLINGAGIMLMFIGGPPALAFNWNPLLRLDGYYMLMDFLEAPNLMDNSYKYLGYLIRSRVFRLPGEPVAPPRRLRRAYIIYGICSFLFIAPWIIYMPLVAYYIFSSMFGAVIALPIAVMIGWRMLSRPATKAVATLRYAWQSHRPAVLAGQRGSARTLVLWAGAAVALALLAFGPRFAVRAHGAGVLEPAERAEVRAAWAGFVTPDTDTPREGDQVKPGELLARLENPDLVMEQKDAALEEESLRTERESLEARGDPAAASAWRVRERAALEKAAILSGRIGALSIKSPIAGVVLTPRLEDRAGSYLRPGDTWCVLGTLQRLRVKLIVTERDLGLIHEGGEAEIKGYHFPDRVFHGRVTRLPAGRRPARPEPDVTHHALPVTAWMASSGGEPVGAGSLDVDVELDNAEGLLRPGMTVRVRIYGEGLTPAGHVAMWARRLFRGKIWW